MFFGSLNNQFSHFLIFYFLEYRPLFRATVWKPYGCKQNIYEYQHSNISKRKGGQIRFTVYQTDMLERQFYLNKYLLPEDRKLIAENLNLTDRQVKKARFICRTIVLLHSFPGKNMVPKQTSKVEKVPKHRAYEF